MVWGGGQAAVSQRCFVLYRDVLMTLALTRMKNHFQLVEPFFPLRITSAIFFLHLCEPPLYERSAVERLFR